mgnify:CR=1 FL=1
MLIISQKLIHVSETKSDEEKEIFFFSWGIPVAQHSCYNESALFNILYHSGFVAGSEHANRGGAANYQCLHTEPEFNSFSSGGPTSLISGAEYESQQLGIFPNAAFQQNVPCARCYTQRSATVMIPSRRSCPTGWTKEYEGKINWKHLQAIFIKLCRDNFHLIAPIKIEVRRESYSFWRPTPLLSLRVDLVCGMRAGSDN